MQGQSVQVINQVVALVAMAVITKAAYSLEKVYSPKVEISPPVKPEGENKLEEFMAKRKHEVELARMFPKERIEEIKRKELRRYKAAQDKKWENWLEAVSK